MTEPLTDDQLRALIVEAIRREDRDNWTNDLGTGVGLSSGRTVATVLADAVTEAVKPELEQVRADRDRLRDQVHAVAQVRCWTNEDGRSFLFADDVRAALDLTAARACACGAEPVHQNGCEDGQ